MLYREAAIAGAGGGALAVGGMGFASANAGVSLGWPSLWVWVIAAVVAWQYWQRRTGIARVVAAALILGSPLIALLADDNQKGPAFQNYRPEVAAHPRADLSRLEGRIQKGEVLGPAPRIGAAPGHSVAALPLAFAGLADSVALAGWGEGQAAADITMAPVRIEGNFQRRGDQYWYVVWMRSQDYKRMDSRGAYLRLRLRLTASTDKPSFRMPVTATATPVPGVGRCQITRSNYTGDGLFCVSGGYNPPPMHFRLINKEWSSDRYPTTNYGGERPAVGGLRPVNKAMFWMPLEEGERRDEFLSDPGTQIEFTPEERVAYKEVIVRARVRLQDYVRTGQ